MLRLIHPSPKGQEKRTRKGCRTGNLSPTPEERLRIHAALRNLARAYGGFDVLAEVIGVNPATLPRAKQQASYGIAVLAARAAGIPVEQILSPGLTDIRACSVCGRKGAK